MTDPNFTDPFGVINDKDKTKKCLEDMNKIDTKAYLQQRIKLLKNRRANWMANLIDQSKYKNPAMINMTQFDHFPSNEYNNREENLYYDIYPGDRPIGESRMDKGEKTGDKQGYIGADMNYILSEMDGSQDLWVGITYSTPGRHNYIVRFEEEINPKKALKLHQLHSLDSYGQMLQYQQSSSYM